MRIIPLNAGCLWGQSERQNSRKYFFELFQKYSNEQRTLTDEITALEAKISQVERTTQDVEDFIRNIKKYLEVPELTRKMYYNLIYRIEVGGFPKITVKELVIEIVYKVNISSATPKIRQITDKRMSSSWLIRFFMR